MSVIIRNIGENNKGNHNYEVLINREFITMFEHKRTDGLAVCLRKAADAVELVDREREKA